MFTSPSPHFWSTTSFFLPLEALQSPPTDSGTQHMRTTHGSLTPLYYLAKVQGCTDVTTIKQQQSHNLRCRLPFKFHKLPREQGKTKMAYGLLKDSLEEKINLRMMTSTLLNEETVLSSSSYFRFAPNFKKLNKNSRNHSFHQTNTEYTASLIPSSFSISTRGFTTQRQFQIVHYGVISLWSIYSIQPLAFLLNTCWDGIIPFTEVLQICIFITCWYRVSWVFITFNTKLIHSLKIFNNAMWEQNTILYFTV